MQKLIIYTTLNIVVIKKTISFLTMKYSTKTDKNKNIQKKAGNYY